jgi:hypothetical protein
MGHLNYSLFNVISSPDAFVFCASAMVYLLADYRDEKSKIALLQIAAPLGLRSE